MNECGRKARTAHWLGVRTERRLPGRWGSIPGAGARV